MIVRYQTNSDGKTELVVNGKLIPAPNPNAALILTVESTVKAERIDRYDRPV